MDRSVGTRHAPILHGPWYTPPMCVEITLLPCSYLHCRPGLSGLCAPTITHFMFAALTRWPSMDVRHLLYQNFIMARFPRQLAAGQAGHGKFDLDNAANVQQTSQKVSEQMETLLCFPSPSRHVMIAFSTSIISVCLKPTPFSQTSSPTIASQIDTNTI